MRFVLSSHLPGPLASLAAVASLRSFEALLALILLATALSALLDPLNDTLLLVATLPLLMVSLLALIEHAVELLFVHTLVAPAGKSLFELANLLHSLASLRMLLLLLIGLDGFVELLILELLAFLFEGLDLVLLL